MCDTIDVEKFEIEVLRESPPKGVLAFANIQMGEMKIKGFVIAEGQDRNNPRQINQYVRAPSSPKRFGHQRIYFWIEDDEKWARLQERILAKFREEEAEEELPFG